DFLKAFSTSCRHTAIAMLKQSQSGHPGGSLSCLDYLSLIYAFLVSQSGEKVLVSNGHISPGLYSVLAELGYIPKQELIDTFRQVGSIYEGHVTRHVPGVWYGTGPLGIGLAAATGFAQEAKLRGSEETVFCLVGDGESQEGEVYETMHYANKYQLNNLIVFMDYNQIQLSGPLDEIMPVDFPAIFKSAHWQVIDVDGHDYQALWTAIHHAKQNQNAPTILLGRTLMGKGVDYMEQDTINNSKNWHGEAPKSEQADLALAQLQLSAEQQALLDQFRKQQVKWKPEQPFALEKNPIQVDIGKPIILAPDVVTDCRSAYGNALKDLADRNTAIIGFTADLGGSVKTDIMKKAHPNRVFDSGVAEQHMLSCSGGLSLAGLVPFCSTFGAFMSSRAKDQARVNDINRCNVKMVSTHCGLSVGEDGPTHQAIDDMGSFLGFFNTTICEPSDPNHCDHIIRHVARTYGNFYVRMGRAKLPIITKDDGSPFYDASYDFQPGHYDLLRAGSDITVLAAGPMVEKALVAREQLKKECSIEVIVMSSLSDPDRDLIARSARKTGRVLTLEDHNPHSGYATMVAALLAREKISVALRHLAVEGYQLSGKAEELYVEAGLGLEHVVGAIRSLCSK
ncbi:MAG: transketolase, partial [bacterium]|nr:transketolase [bacterium]